MWLGDIVAPPRPSARTGRPVTGRTTGVRSAAPWQATRPGGPRVKTRRAWRRHRQWTNVGGGLHGQTARPPSEGEHMDQHYRAAWDALTAPGAPFAWSVTDVRGVPTRTYDAAPPNLTLLWAGSVVHGDADYLVYQDERMSYAEAHVQVDAIASHLAAIGVGHGDRVALAMRNYPEWVLGYWATLKLGATVVGLNAWWTGPEMEFGLADSSPRALLCDAERLERVAPYLDSPAVRSAHARGRRPPRPRCRVARGRRPVGGCRGRCRRPAGRTHGRDRTGGRPLHLLHLGHHRASEGSCADPPWRRLQPVEPGLLADDGRSSPGHGRRTPESRPRVRTRSPASHIQARSWPCRCSTSPAATAACIRSPRSVAA